MASFPRVRSGESLSGGVHQSEGFRLKIESGGATRIRSLGAVAYTFRLVKGEMESSGIISKGAVEFV